MCTRGIKEKLFYGWYRIADERRWRCGAWADKLGSEWDRVDPQPVSLKIKGPESPGRGRHPLQVPTGHSSCST